MDSPPDDVAPGDVTNLTAELADAVAARLAPDHAREIRELSGLAPGPALRLSLAQSLLAYAVTDTAGEPVFLIGVEPAGPLTGTAQVWMVGTPELPRHARKVLRRARWGLGRAFAATGAAALEQYIPAWYGTGLRFAERLGFRPGPGGDKRIQHVIKEKENTWAYPHSMIF